LCAREVPEKHLEAAALDLFALGRVRSREELQAGIAAVRPAQLRAAFACMLDARAAIAIAGNFAQRDVEDVARVVGGMHG